MTQLLDRPAELLYGLPPGGLDAAGRWVGYTQPRLFTPPLGLLTPETSLGFDAIRFAERVLQVRLLPWQKWWLIHALELNPDGSFRFRIILTLIARQNGKTFLLKVVALYFMYIRQVRLVLGCAQDLRIARESWDGAYDLAAGVPALSAEFVINPRTRPGRRDGAGNEAIVLHPVCPATGKPKPSCECPRCSLAVLDDREYRVSAATKSAGRGLTVDLLIMDEFRHCTQLAWAALSKTTTARPDALILPISNAGTDESEVLNTMRVTALAGDVSSIGILEWSGEDGCELDDPEGNMHANPALGYGMLTEGALAAFRATDSPEVYRTEDLCQRVAALDILISDEAWKRGLDPHLTLASVPRSRLAVVFEVSPDGEHATLVAGGRFADGRIGLDVLGSWNDLRRAEKEFPGLVAKVNPGLFGWLAGGPAKEFGGKLRMIKGSQEIKGERVSEACHTLVGMIRRNAILHGGDPLLTAHCTGVRRLDVSDGYRFVRKGAGHCDAAYAAAGVVLLLESVPAEPKTSGVWVV